MSIKEEQAPSARDQAHYDKTKPIHPQRVHHQHSTPSKHSHAKWHGHSTGTQGTCRWILHDPPEHSARDYVHAHELREPFYLSQLRMVIRLRRVNDRSTYQVETLKVTLSAKTLKVSL